MRMPVLVLMVSTLVVSVFGMGFLLLKLTNIERVQRGEVREGTDFVRQIVCVPKVLAIQFLLIEINMKCLL